MLRPLIRSLIAEGQLPVTRKAHVWGGSGTGVVCSACGERITKAEVGIETSRGSDETNLLQLHVHCFHVWASEIQGPEEGRQVS